MRAVAAGQVIAIRCRGAGGLFVLVSRAGFDALYTHLGSVAPALVGGKRAIEAGKILRVVRRTGVSYGAHLYFQVEISGQHIDLAPHLGIGRCG